MNFSKMFIKLFPFYRNYSDIAPRREWDKGKLIKGFSNLTFWWYSVLLWLSQGTYICAAKDGMRKWVLKLQHTQIRSLRIFIWQAIVRRPSVSTEGLFYFAIEVLSPGLSFGFSRLPPAHTLDLWLMRTDLAGPSLWPRLFSKLSPSSSFLSYSRLSFFLPLPAFFRLFFSIFAAHLQGLPAAAAPGEWQPAR